MKHTFLFAYILILTAHMSAGQMKERSTLRHLIDTMVPLIDESGEVVLIPAQPYSCCIDYGKEILRLKVNGAEVLERMLVEAGDDTTRVSSEKILSNVHTIDSIVKSAKYQDMAQLQTFELIPQPAKKHAFVLQFVYREQVAKTSMFLLLPIKTSGFCCGELMGDASCNLSPEVGNIWISHERKLLLVEYGLSKSVGDGCEVGPLYQIAHFTY